jgi:sec-independent protein translocase protein TatA
MGLDAPWHWVILALIVVALFGYKKLPEASRSIAQSLRAFKSEMRTPTDAPVSAPPAVTPVVAAGPHPVTPAVATAQARPTDSETV